MFNWLNGVLFYVVVVFVLCLVLFVLGFVGVMWCSGV